MVYIICVGLYANTRIVFWRIQIFKLVNSILCFMDDLESLTAKDTARRAEQSRDDAHHRVEKTFAENKVQYTRRDNLSYNIPNFPICFREVVCLAKDALKETEFYAQEMPYREMMPEFTPEYLLILHRDDHQ